MRLLSYLLSILKYVVSLSVSQIRKAVAFVKSNNVISARLFSISFDHILELVIFVEQVAPVQPVQPV